MYKPVGLKTMLTLCRQMVKGFSVGETHTQTEDVLAYFHQTKHHKMVPFPFMFGFKLVLTKKAKGPQRPVKPAWWRASYLGLSCAFCAASWFATLSHFRDVESPSEVQFQQQIQRPLPAEERHVCQCSQAFCATRCCCRACAMEQTDNCSNLEGLVDWKTLLVCLLSAACGS